MTVTITINLPENLVASVQRLGEATARNISEVLVDTLEIILPTFNNLPENSLNSEISQMSNQEVISFEWSNLMLNVKPRFASFAEYLQYNDNSEKLYELFNGQLIEMPPESGLNIQIANRLF